MKIALLLVASWLASAVVLAGCSSTKSCSAGCLCITDPAKCTGGCVPVNAGTPSFYCTNGVPANPQDASTADQQAVDGPAAVLSSCNPLAPKPLPITLGTVIAAGRDSAGVLYAVDQVDSGERVFVSDASGTLVRQRIAGSGMGPDFYVFSVTDHNPAFVLQIDTPAGGLVRMGVMIGTLKDSKTFVIGQQGEELTVLPDGAIAGMPVQNLPGTVVVEYGADAANFDVMIVTRPQDDWSYADFRLFLGNMGAVTERRVSNVIRARDGGTTTIWFELDGQQAQAYFPVVYADGGFAPGPATLTVAGTTMALTRQSGAPAGATYLCLS